MEVTMKELIMMMMMIKKPLVKREEICRTQGGAGEDQRSSIEGGINIRQLSGHLIRQKLPLEGVFD
jgi:hypothetical protein